MARDSHSGLFEKDARGSAKAQLVFGVLAGGVGVAALAAAPGLGVKLGVGLPALFLCALWVVSGIRVLSAPWGHTSYDVFGKAASDRRAGARDVEAQLAEPETVVFGRGDSRAFVTREWFVSTAGGVEAIPLRTLLWCYPESTKYSVNFIPVADVSRIVLYASEGRHAQLPLKVPVLVGSDPTQSLLEVLALHAPHAFYGYRPEWAGNWQAVRKAVTQKLEERRRQMTSAAEP